MTNLPSIEKSLYPWQKVLSVYAVGGALGGFLIGAFALITLLIKEQTLQSLSLGLLFSLVTMLFGLILGFIPSMLTGIFLSIIKKQIDSWLDYIAVAVIGFLVTSVCYVCWEYNTILTSEQLLSTIIEVVERGVIFSVIGAICAMILAKFSLPKGLKYE